uniref:Uncharacterized protein n=1 Tax=Plectus sambesii TaxID=2011161 RepID=A0A914WJM8_9BILA
MADGSTPNLGSVDEPVKDALGNDTERRPTYPELEIERAFIRYTDDGAVPTDLPDLDAPPQPDSARNEETPVVAHEEIERQPAEGAPAGERQTPEGGVDEVGVHVASHHEFDGEHSGRRYVTVNGGVTADGQPIVQCVALDASDTGAGATETLSSFHHVTSQNQFEPQQWSGDHEESEFHPSLRNDETDIVVASHLDDDERTAGEEKKVASSDDFPSEERKRLDSLIGGEEGENSFVQFMQPGQQTGVFTAEPAPAEEDHTHADQPSSTTETPAPTTDDSHTESESTRTETTSYHAVSEAKKTFAVESWDGTHADETNEHEEHAAHSEQTAPEPTEVASTAEEQWTTPQESVGGASIAAPGTVIDGVYNGLPILGAVAASNEAGTTVDANAATTNAATEEREISPVQSDDKVAQDSRERRSQSPEPVTIVAEADRAAERAAAESSADSSAAPTAVPMSEPVEPGALDHAINASAESMQSDQSVPAGASPPVDAQQKAESCAPPHLTTQPFRSLAAAPQYANPTDVSAPGTVVEGVLNGLPILGAVVPSPKPRAEAAMEEKSPAEPVAQPAQSSPESAAAPPSSASQQSATTVQHQSNEEPEKKESHPGDWCNMLASEKLSQLEEELRALGMPNSSASSGVTNMLQSALDRLGPGGDLQIKMNSQRQKKTTTMVYESEMPGFKGLNTAEIMDMQGQLMNKLKEATASLRTATADSKLCCSLTIY